jgi:hypothetical protein
MVSAQIRQKYYFDHLNSTPSCRDSSKLSGNPPYIVTFAAYPLSAVLACSLQLFLPLLQNCGYIP